MAVSINTSGTLTPTVGTETDLATITAAGIYQLKVDISNLAAGEVVELRAYEKVKSGGTERLSWPPSSYGPIPPETKVVTSLAVVTAVSVRFTLKQVGGTARAFDWAIYSTGA